MPRGVVGAAGTDLQAGHLAHSRPWVWKGVRDQGVRGYEGCWDYGMWLSLLELIRRGQGRSRGRRSGGGGCETWSQITRLLPGPPSLAPKAPFPPPPPCAAAPATYPPSPPLPHLPPSPSPSPPLPLTCEAIHRVG